MFCLPILFGCLHLKAITWSTPAISLKEAVSQVAAYTGQKLYVDPAMGNDPIIVSVHSVDSDELLKRIAKITMGRWVTQSETQILERDPSALADAEVVSRRLFARYLSADIGDFSKRRIGKSRLAFPLKYEEAASYIRKVVSKLRPVEVNGRHENYSGYPSSLGTLPGNLAMEEALRKVSPEDIYGLGKRGRVVLSTNPTPRQMPWGEIGAEILRDYAASVKPWNDAALESGGGMSADSPFGSAPPRVGLPEKIRFVIDKDLDSVTFILSVLNRKGRIIDEVRESFSEAPEWNSDADPTLPKSDHDQDVVRFSHVAILLNDVPDYGQLEPAEPDLFNALLHPTTFDPLRASPSEALIGLAEAEKWNLVATLSDEAVRPPPFQKKHFIRISEIKDWMRTLRISAKDGWLEVTAKDPVSAQEGRLDRAALENLVEELNRPGATYLEPLARFCIRFPGCDRSILLYYLATIFPMSEWSFSIPLLKCYGSLSEEQRKALLADQGLAIVALSPAQQQWFTEAKKESSFDFGWSSGPSGFAIQPDGTLRNVNSPQVEPVGRADREATESPGSEEETYLKGAFTETPIFFFVRKVTGSPPMAQDIGVTEFASMSQPQVDSNDWFVAPRKFLVGTKRTLQITLSNGTQLALLSERHFSNLTIYSKDNMPEPIKILVETEMKKLKGDGG